jgi:hypothetical protein
LLSLPIPHSPIAHAKWRSIMATLLTVIYFPLKAICRGVGHWHHAFILSLSWDPKYQVKSRKPGRPEGKHRLPPNWLDPPGEVCSFIKWRKHHLLENVAVRIKWKNVYKVSGSSKHWENDSFFINSPVREVFFRSWNWMDKKLNNFSKVCSDFLLSSIYYSKNDAFLFTWHI